MQGSLGEIDLRSLMQVLELEQRTGVLFVIKTNGNFSDGQKSETSQYNWLVFFVKGEITYACQDANNDLSRLQDYLLQYKIEEDVNQLFKEQVVATNVYEYDRVLLLLEKQLITPAQGRRIVENMVNEVLFELLSLQTGIFFFESNFELKPPLTSLEIAPVLRKITRNLQQWKEFYPYIKSPHQCPSVSDDDLLRSFLSDNAYKTITNNINGKTSFLQLSRYFNRDIVTIAKVVYPYIQKGAIQLVENTQDKLIKKEDTNSEIVIISNDETISEPLSRILLSYHKYQVTILTEGIKSVGRIFEIKPKLIFCQVSPDRMSAYQICQILRSSITIQNTPLVILSEGDNFIERLKLKILGATDYLNVPFSVQEVLLLLKKYHNLSNSFSLPLTLLEKSDIK